MRPVLLHVLPTLRGRADGPPRRSTLLSEVREALILEFRPRTLLPLDELLGCLPGPISALSRSALHRYLQRHGMSRLARGGQPPKRGCFAEKPLGFVHLDSCEVRSAERKRHLFRAIDRVTRFADIEFHRRTGLATGAWGYPPRSYW